MACIYGVEQPCDECRMCKKENYRENEKEMTNADWIRGMGNTELADFLVRVEQAGYNDTSIAPIKTNSYPMDMLEWLESEYKENGQ